MIEFVDTETRRFQVLCMGVHTCTCQNECSIFVCVKCPTFVDLTTMFNVYVPANRVDTSIKKNFPLFFFLCICHYRS